MSAPLRVGVAGTGHFGRYHALKLLASPRAILTGLHDHNAARAAAVVAETGAPALSFPDLLAASDAIIIATPAAAHHSLAATSLRAGKHVLVEKPIATTLAEADDLARLAAAGNRVLQIGHLERFSAAQGALAGRVGAPLYIEAARNGTFKPRGTDVSVVLDLMIHDLDLILTLTGSEIVSIDAFGTPFASPRLDFANARIRFASGAIANITANRIAPVVERRMHIFSADSYVAIDFANRRLAITRTGSEAEEVCWQDHDALAAEQEAFFAAILDGASIVVDAQAGRRALAAALAVTAAIS